MSEEEDASAQHLARFHLLGLRRVYTLWECPPAFGSDVGHCRLVGGCCSLRLRHILYSQLPQGSIVEVAVGVLVLLSIMSSPSDLTQQVTRILLGCLQGSPAHQQALQDQQRSHPVLPQYPSDVAVAPVAEVMGGVPRGPSREVMALLAALAASPQGRVPAPAPVPLQPPVPLHAGANLAGSLDLAGLLRLLQGQPTVTHPQVQQHPFLGSNVESQAILLQQMYQSTSPQHPEIPPVAPLAQVRPVLPLAQVRPQLLLPRPPTAAHQPTAKNNEANEAIPSASRNQREILSNIIEPTFPIILHRMLADVHASGQDNIICFNPEGDVVLILDREALMDDVVPKYFRMKSIASFRRQLCLYGFVRCLCGDKQGYRHDSFHRDRPEKAKEIRRRPPRADPPP